MIDELAHAGPEHLDPDFVAGYDRKQGYPDPAQDLDALAALGLGAASAVVDLGAGASSSIIHDSATRPLSSARQLVSPPFLSAPRPGLHPVAGRLVPVPVARDIPFPYNPFP